MRSPHHRRRLENQRMATIADKSPDAQAAPASSSDVRTQLAQLRARHDHGAVSPAVFSVIRKLETEIAWAEHLGQQAK
jgi:hypothetical protein